MTATQRYILDNSSVAMVGAADLRPYRWTLLQTLQIPDWCGYSIGYLPAPKSRGWWPLMPIWKPDREADPVRGSALPEPR